MSGSGRLVWLGAGTACGVHIQVLLLDCCHKHHTDDVVFDMASRRGIMSWHHVVASTTLYQISNTSTCCCSPPRTCVWTELPSGWQEYHDPITGQPYYYNPQTQQKTWARPVEQLVCPSAVTATRLTSMEQPRSCQPGSKRRSGGGALTGQANSSSSTLSLALAGQDSVAAPGQVAASVKQDTPEPPAAAVS
jgi:hypothetical protein